jgi:hypothetical protein
MSENPSEHVDFDESCAPPDAIRVLRRALAMSCVICRSFIEIDEDRQFSEGLLVRMRDWIVRIGLDEEFEPSEMAMIQAPIGDLDRRDVVNGTWRSEGLLVLAWALRRHDMLPHDVMAVPVEVSNAIGFLAEDALSSAQPELRSQEELDGFDSVQLALHWRLRDFSLRPSAMNFRDFVEHCEWAKLKIDALTTLVDNDIAIDGVRIDLADAPRVHQCHSAAMERHQAINWLRGWGALYSEVDTST